MNTYGALASLRLQNRVSTTNGLACFTAHAEVLPRGWAACRHVGTPRKVHRTDPLEMCTFQFPTEKWDNGAIDGYTMLCLPMTGVVELRFNWGCRVVTKPFTIGCPSHQWWGLADPALNQKSRTEFELRRGTWATVGSWWFDIPIGGHQMPLKMGNRWASMKSIWVSHVTLRYIEWSL